MRTPLSIRVDNGVAVVRLYIVTVAIMPLNHFGKGTQLQMVDTKRASICKKVYINSDGKETAHASPDAESLEFRFESGETIVVELDSIADNCRRAATWHGISQKLGDKYAGKSVDEAHNEVATLLERLQQGDWIKAREAGAGPRPSVLVDAVVAALEENGETVDAERRARIKAKLADPDEKAAAMNNPLLKSHYERIKAETATAKAAAAADLAEGVETNLGDF